MPWTNLPRVEKLYAPQKYLLAAISGIMVSSFSYEVIVIWSPREVLTAVIRSERCL